MRYTPQDHHRQSIRLKDYDYSQAGAYFITICTYRRKCLFGNIANGAMEPNHFGIIIQETWDALPLHYQYIRLDEFVVMPNHVHGIIIFLDDLDMNVGAGLKPAPTRRHGLPEIVRGFKSFSSRSINQLRQSPGSPVWQRNYYEHVIRSQDDLDQARQYILNNPAKWSEDRENPQNIRLNGVNTA
jgi:REP element-mobilizing transposase RayT